MPAKPAEAVDAGGSASDLTPQPGEVGVDTDEPLRHVALAVTDDEGLARLRARYAEIQTRIGDRFRDPARLEELRAQAALIDPDGWRTIDEARALLARGEQQLRGVYALELGKLLCKRGEVERLAGDLDAARAARDEAASIAARIEAGPDSELGRAVAALNDALAR